MASLSTTHAAAVQHLLKTLGIPPFTTEVVIKFKSGHPVEVKTTSYVEDSTFEQFVDVTRFYELVERKDKDGGAK